MAAARVHVFGNSGQLATGRARVIWPTGIGPALLDRAAADFCRPEQLALEVATGQPDRFAIAACFSIVDRDIPIQQEPTGSA